MSKKLFHASGPLDELALIGECLMSRPYTLPPVKWEKTYYRCDCQYRGKNFHMQSPKLAMVLKDYLNFIAAVHQEEEAITPLNSPLKSC